MATGLYLKKTLSTNIPKILTIKKRGGAYPEKDFTTKQPTGKMTYLYIFADVTGQELKHYSNEREEDTLKDYQPGQEVQVVLQESMKNINGVDKRISYLVWGTPGSAEMTATPQLKSNTAMQTQQRQGEDHAKAQKTKEIAISLQGFMQAYISTGNYTREEALKLAVEARELLLMKAIEISQS